MRPQRRAFIAGTTACDQKNAPSRLTASTRRHSSTSVASTLLLDRMPALLTRMSTGAERAARRARARPRTAPRIADVAGDGERRGRRSSRASASHRCRGDVDQRDAAAVVDAARCTTARPIVPPAPVTTRDLVLRGRIVACSCVEHALLAEQAARAEGDDGDEQQVHRHQRPLRRIGAGQADDQADQQPGDTAPQRLPTPPSTMIRNAGTTASTPTCGRMPQIGAITTPAIAASADAEREHDQAQPRQVDAERAHHLAVVRAGLDDRAVRRLLEEEPEQPRSSGTAKPRGEEAVARVDQVADQRPRPRSPRAAAAAARPSPRRRGSAPRSRAPRRR